MGNRRRRVHRRRYQNHAEQQQDSPEEIQTRIQDGDHRCVDFPRTNVNYIFERLSFCHVDSEHRPDSQRVYQLTAPVDGKVGKLDFTFYQFRANFLNRIFGNGQVHSRYQHQQLDFQYLKACRSHRTDKLAERIIGPDPAYLQRQDWHLNQKSHEFQVHDDWHEHLRI